MENVISILAVIQSITLLITFINLKGGNAVQRMVIIIFFRFIPIITICTIVSLLVIRYVH